MRKIKKVFITIGIAVVVLSCTALSNVGLNPSVPNMEYLPNDKDPGSMH
ncbi:hypothetical protein J2S07_001576 [Robertmurraya andreesenii]|uniref:Lipoprotein n=1 Tax=Anoxybacillus andreesenii TaxID=1325932 RepID=A0ABT9V2U7_9BACL|nr:hypothetical protein [Robertmurraya andreesenii]